MTTVVGTMYIHATDTVHAEAEPPSEPDGGHLLCKSAQAPGNVLRCVSAKRLLLLQRVATRCQVSSGTPSCTWIGCINAEPLNGTHHKLDLLAAGDTSILATSGPTACSVALSDVLLQVQEIYVSVAFGALIGE